MKDNIDWNICPPEILCMIFKYLNAKALISCMKVNDRWKDVAEHTAEVYNHWEAIVNIILINKGTTFANKSSLDWGSIYRNSKLWNHVSSCNIKKLKTYEIQGVRKMNVYKDSLILINNSQVMYYDLKTFTLIRAFPSTSVNFEENDHMIVKLSQEQDLTKTLYLYIKTQADKFRMVRSSRHVVNDIRLYRLENKRCYVLTTTNLLWAFAHKVIHWDVEFIARHYGNEHDAVNTIHVCNDFVYIVTKFGAVWYADTRNARFVKVYQLRVPNNISNHNWTMFDCYSYVVPVTANTNERVKFHFEAKSDVMMLQCSGLTSALQHGDVLILGYNDGRVEIRIPIKRKRTNGKDPERYFNIQQFYEHVDDSTITALNVHETEDAHTLLVCTRAHIFQLQLTYPQNLL